MKNQPFYIDLKFRTDIDNLKNKVGEVANQINKIGNTSGGTQLQGQFNQLTKSVADLQQRASQPIYSQAEMNKLTQDLSKAENSYNSLLGTVQKMKGYSDSKKLELLPADQLNRIQRAEQALTNYEKAAQQTKNKIKELKAEQEKLVKQEAIKKTADDDVKKYSKEVEEATKKLKELQGEQARLEGEKEGLKAEQSGLRGKRTSAERKGDSAEVARLNQELEKSLAKSQQIKTRLGELKPQIDNAASAETRFTKQLHDAENKASTAATSIATIKTNISSLNTSKTKELETNFEALKQSAAQLGVKVDDLKDSSSIDTLTQRMQALKTQGLDQANTSINKTEQELNGLKNAMNQAGSSVNKAEQAFQKFERKMQDFDQMRSQITYFFSMANAVQLLRQAFQDAVQSVKDLDAVMTEAAVVTDFSIDDMWSRLPEYSKRATDLGVATKELYEATTLYYQQGLKTNQAMDVGIETMKMAKIAGLEAGDATQYMTAALRGFNMEVSKTSATRVNDVYSNLAAITASDTGQIATAMSKTASIASAANMEFETTAALLAQIIETTQEAPETAGTALKTIIARFSEVKDLQSKGQSTGKDEEGEEINVNKIDAALKSVGISMKGFFSGTQGLDEILLELASVWDTLDFSTQRYIATMAAGSRQQSRFIAMMSDYARSQELVSAANNSAGASSDQFDKTLDSLDSKLNQLHNTWETFTMGIANTTFLKEGIEILTALIEGLNLAIEFFSGLAAETDATGKKIETTMSKAIKSILSLVAIISSIAVGKGLVEGLFARMSIGFDKKKKSLQDKAQGKNSKDNSNTKGSQQVNKDLTEGGRNAKQGLTEGAREAGEILKNAAQTAAGTEENSAIAEGETEIASAHAENKTEQLGVTNKINAEYEAELQRRAMQRSGVQEDVMIDKQAAVEEAQIEINTAKTKGSTELVAVEAKNELEIAGGVTEAQIETQGALAESQIETQGALAEGQTELLTGEALAEAQFKAAFKTWMMQEKGISASMAEVMAEIALWKIKERAYDAQQRIYDVETSVLKRNIELGLVDPATIPMAPQLLGTGANDVVTDAPGAMVTSMDGFGGIAGYLPLAGMTFLGLGGKKRLGLPPGGSTGGSYSGPTDIVPYKKGEVAVYNKRQPPAKDSAPPTDPTSNKKESWFKRIPWKTVLTIGAIIAAVVAAIAIMDAAEKKLDRLYETSKERLNALKKNESSLAESSSAVNKELSEFESNKQSLKERIRDLDKLSKHSSEWASSIHEVRTEMQGILDKYPELREFTTFENGVRVLTEQGWDEYEKALLADQAQLTQSLYATRMSIKAEQDYMAAEQLKLKTSSVTAEEKEKLKLGNKIGGFAGGIGLGIGGAALLGLIGLGPIGILLGGILGAALGAGGGIGIAHLLTGATQGVDPELVNKVALEASYATLAEGNMAFSAVEATDEEIDKFLAEEMELTGEDFEDLSKYIKENKEEFDKHSAALRESADAFYEYALAYGASRAEELGYTGEAADVYALVNGMVSRGLFDEARRAAKAEADMGLWNSTTEEGIRLIEEGSGFTYDAEVGAYRTKEGELLDDEQFNDLEKKQAWITGRAQEKLNAMTDATYNYLNVQGLDYAKTVASMASLNSGQQGSVSLDAYQTYYGDGKVVEHIQQDVAPYLEQLKTEEGRRQLAVDMLQNDSEIQDAGLRYQFSYIDQMDNLKQDAVILDKELLGKQGYERYEAAGKRGSDINLNRSVEEQQNRVLWQTAAYELFTESSYNYLKKEGTTNTHSYLFDEDQFAVAFATHTGITPEAARAIIKDSETGGTENLERLYGSDFMTEAQEDLHWGDQQNLSRLDYLTLASDPTQGGMEFLRYADVNEAIKFSQMVQGFKEFYDLGMYEENGALESVFNNLMTAMVGELEPQKERIATLLQGIELDELEDLETVTTYLQDIWETEAFKNLSEDEQEAFLNATKNWETLVEYLDKAGVAIANLDIEGLVEKLKKIQSLLKKIRDTDIGDASIFTDEEYSNLIGAGADKNDFVATVDGFVYIGDKISELDGTLKKTNDILLGQQTSALRSSIRLGQFVQSDEDLLNYNYQTAGTQSAEQIANQVIQMFKAVVENYNETTKGTKIQESTKNLLGYNITKEALIDLVDAAGLSEKFPDVEGVWTMLLSLNPGSKKVRSGEAYDEFWTNQSGEFQRFYLDLFTDMGIAGQQLDQNTKLWKDTLQQIKLEGLSTMSGNEMLRAVGTETRESDAGPYTWEDVNLALDAQMERLGLSVMAATSFGYVDDVITDDYIKTEAEKARQDTYDNLKDQGATTAQAKDQSELAYEEKYNELLANRAAIVKALTLDAYNNAKQIEQLGNKYGKFGEILKKENRGFADYGEAMGQLKEGLEDAFDTVLDPAFMTDNATTIEAAVAGDQQAWDTLTTNIRGSILEGLGYSEEDFQEWQSKLPIPEIGITSTFKDTGVLAAMWGLEELGNYVTITQEQMDALKSEYDTIGVTLNFDTTPMYNVGGTWVKSENNERPAGAVGGPVYALNNVSMKNNGNRNPFSSKNKGGSKDKWENPYDKFYNTYEKINYLLREREQLERRYDKLLKNRDVTSKKLIKNAQKQLDGLAEQKKLQEYLQDGKLQEIRDLRKENSKYSKYVTGYDEATGVIQINWEAIDKIKSSKTGEAVEAYVSKLEELRDQWRDTQDAIEEIDDAVEEIRERGRDQFIELEGRLKEAMVEARQKEIDKLSEINDSINDTNSKILDSMQEQIDQYRQDRDNQKTEEEITDKQRRLAYLQQDTSGANATEILNLQKEIEEAQEDYTDTLIDQKISELEEQNDKAAEQRERQIEIMEAQLEHDQKVGAFWDEIHSMINNALNDDGSLNLDSDLVNLLKDIEEYAGMSGMEKDEFIKELVRQYSEGISFLELNRAKEEEKITFKTADGREITGVADAAGNIVTENGTSYSGVRQNMNGDWTTSENYYEAPPEPEKTAWNSPYPMPSSITATLKKDAKNNKDDVKGLQTALKTLGFYSGEIDGSFGPGTKAALKNFQKSALISDWGKEIEDLKKNGTLDAATKQAFANHPLYQFKTGGLADFTGPAWLDGTKSRPEYILNADQTKGFFGLIDVLGALRHNQSKTAQNNGDNSFDIDINVESIGNDYDVERLADKVKTLIVDSAYYRNNNAINLTR